MCCGLHAKIIVTLLKVINVTTKKSTIIINYHTEMQTTMTLILSPVSSPFTLEKPIYTSQFVRERQKKVSGLRGSSL